MRDASPKKIPVVISHEERPRLMERNIAHQFPGPAGRPGTMTTAGLIMAMGGMPASRIGLQEPPSAPASVGNSSTMPQKTTPTSANAEGYANFNEWVAVHGPRQGTTYQPSRPSQVQPTPQQHQPMQEGRPRQADSSLPQPVFPDVINRQKRIQSQYYRPQRDGRSAPKPHFDSIAAPTELLSLACQARKHNLEWKQEYHPKGFAYSVVADGHTFRSPGGYYSEKEAKTATAKVALEGLRKLPHAQPQVEALLAGRSNGASITRGVVPTNPRVVAGSGGTERQQELRKLLKRLQELHGSELRDRSQDPPEIAAAFLEGLSVGSRLAGAAIGGNQPSGGSKEAEIRRGTHRGGGRSRPRYTRSRSPAKERHPFRDRHDPNYSEIRHRDTRSQSSIVKQEVSESPSSVLRGIRGAQASHGDRRGGGAMDGRWDHNGYIKRYAPNKPGL